MLWTKSARRDLETIISYLSDQSPLAALNTLDRLERRAQSLITLAERGRVVPELARLQIREYRELVVSPYRIVYRIRGSKVLVHAVLDARRNLEDVLLDRLIRVEGQE